jgi:hypothetical protein
MGNPVGCNTTDQEQERHSHSNANDFDGAWHLTVYISRDLWAISQLEDPAHGFFLCRQEGRWQGPFFGPVAMKPRRDRSVRPLTLRIACKSGERLTEFVFGRP